MTEQEESWKKNCSFCNCYVLFKLKNNLEKKAFNLNKAEETKDKKKQKKL